MHRVGRTHLRRVFLSGKMQLLKFPQVKERNTIRTIGSNGLKTRSGVLNEILSLKNIGYITGLLAVNFISFPLFENVFYFAFAFILTRYFQWIFDIFS